MFCPVCNRAFAPGVDVCPVDGTRLDEDGQAGSMETLVHAQPEGDAPAAQARTGPPFKPGPAALPSLRRGGGSQPAVRANSQPRAQQNGSQPRADQAPEGSSAIVWQTNAAGSGGRTLPPAVTPPAAAAAAAVAPAAAPPTGPLIPHHPASPSNAELPPGTMVGEYQISGLLGTGGMGSVYAGVQPVIGKRVAIKVLLRELAANPQVVGRFMQEARAVNQAQSRHIVDIFSFGELPDGRQYFVMEHLEGQSLRQFLKDRQQLSFDEAYGILRCVTKGLMAAHQSGIVHRDIKPENIMVKAEEEGGLSATILDFGIAKLQSGETSQPGFATRTGAAMGTPYYMSPEQCRGVGVDHRTDIYALGIIMFEMFTGALPFNARSYIDLVNKHLFASPPEPSKLRNNISPVLEALILRCIAKDPAERPQTVEQVLQELQQIAPSLRGTSFNLQTPTFKPGEEVLIPPMTGVGSRPPAQHQRPARSRAKLGLMVGGMVLLLGGSGTAAYLLYSQTENGRGGQGAGTAAPAPARAVLRLATRPPGARVSLDGEPQPGSTPLRLQVSPGTHQLRLELSGYKISAESISLQPGQEESLTFVLVAAEPARQPSTLRISTGIKDAIYFLDDRPVGTGAALTLGSVEPGTHQLRITARGHQPHQETVSVAAGDSVRLEIALPATSGKTSSKKTKKTKKNKKDTKSTPTKQQSGTSEDPDGTLNPFNRKR